MNPHEMDVGASTGERLIVLTEALPTVKTCFGDRFFSPCFLKQILLSAMIEIFNREINFRY